MMHGIAVAAAVVALGCSGTSSGVGDGLSGGTSGTSGGGSSGSSGGTSGSSGGTSSDAETLFKPPAGQATADTIYGVWGGSKESGGITFDTRMKLSKASATLAVRCTLNSSGKASRVVGVTAAARITDTALVFLESKKDEENDGSVRCAVSVVPREVKRCEADVTKGFERNCFKLEGTQLTDFGDSSFDSLELTKLSD